MARFFGRLKGARGEATRLGHAVSGLDTTAASWEGSVHVRLYARGAEDMARVTLEPWHGKGTKRTLYDGPVSGAGMDVTSHIETARQLTKHND